MIRSMTGFGKATGSAGINTVSVEIKSLNSKFLELNLRLPTAYKDKELELRNEIGKSVERGKVDFNITIEQGSGSVKSILNKEVIKKYHKDLNDLQREIKVTMENELDIIMKMPNVLNSDKSEPSAKEWKIIVTLCRKALKDFNNFRIKEGSALQKDFEQRVKELEKLLGKTEKAEPERMKTIKERIGKNMENLDDVKMIDKNRFEQELIYYLEKIDITEEKVRLRSHLKFFTETMKEADSNGKKLGFILQEIGREINTIGAKANNANIQKFVVMMKDELEKMKEQTANII